MVDHIETQSILDARLRVEFLRPADRFGHVVQLIERDVVHSLLASVEGIPADLWPPSPVLQQLHIEGRTDSLGHESRQAVAATRQVALLVGMAGRSHWSLSVEPNIAAAALVFDVACRVDVHASSDLHSTYQPLAVPRLLEAERCVWAVKDSWLITLSIEHPPHAKLRSDSRGLSISPEPAPGATKRWKYRVELTRP